ncbi:MAG: amidohydrolase family protein [Candidatus Eisenbacteria bacterium]|nr:amidohydrolase family protein [Candidatus Eisenbacteria bacterium]
MQDDRIVALGASLPPAGPGVRCLPCTDQLALPGFVQGHLHVCQTLFRGWAEARRLARWLGERILPLEARLDADRMRAAAALGIAEALLGGATTLVDMGSVHHTAVIAEVAERMGVRAIVGKALMDVPADAPAALVQEGRVALAEALALHEQWDGAGGGRLQVALAPRFTPAVSAGLWKRIAREAQRRGLLVHTHISETPWENERCTQMHGAPPVEMLERWGVLAARALLVHAIWITPAQRALLARHGAGLVHCPGSNTKLGSGILDLPALREAGVPVALGSDGAACNDELAILSEMRLGAQLQNVTAGPGRIPAADWLQMATGEGARAVGLAPEIGRLAVGAAADLQLYDPVACGWDPNADPTHSLVYAAGGARPHAVWVAGQPRVWDGSLVGASLESIRGAAWEARAAWAASEEGGAG